MSLNQFGSSRGTELSPRSRTARRSAPAIETSLPACGGAAASSDWSLLIVKGGVPPFTLSPRSRGQRTSSLPFLSSGQGIDIRGGVCVSASSDS